MIKDMKIWENEIPLYDENIPFENKMTAYLHEDGEVHPAMIVYPGGGYCIHGEWECDPVAQFYYDNGYNAFIVYYRVRPYPHPAPMLDAQYAVKNVRAHAAEWHIDPERVFGVGFSAGGHLALAAGVKGENKPNAMILGYPAASAPNLPGMNFMLKLLKGSEEVTDEDAKEFDLVPQITKEYTRQVTISSLNVFFTRVLFRAP